MTNRLTRRQLLQRTAAGGACPLRPRPARSLRRRRRDQGRAEPHCLDTDRPDAGEVAALLELAALHRRGREDEAPPVARAFTKKTGVKVSYYEDINDNDSFFGKIEGPLSRGQSVGRDIIVLTDVSGLPARMIQLGWLEKLDSSAIPNIKNLVPTLAHPDWDPNREYSLPWQSGMTGIGYDPKKVGGELTSVRDLLTNPKLKGKVTLLTEMADTMGLVMLANGDDPGNVTDATFTKAEETIKQAVDSGQIRQFTGNDYAPMLAKGDVWAAFAWSGDIVQLKADNPRPRVDPSRHPAG